MLYGNGLQNGSKAKSIRALARGLEVVRVLNERHSTSLNLLSDRTGISKATLLRILNTLTAAGWVYRYRADKSYRLRSEVCLLGQHVLTLDRITEIAGPILDALYETLGSPSDIAVCTGHGMRILDSTRKASSEGDGHGLLDGHSHMLWSALGRAYLAFCPAAEREAILDNLRHSPDRLDQAVHDICWVKQLLDQTRARGYGVAESGYCRQYPGAEHTFEAIAVPVRRGGRTPLCISLVWSDDEASPEQIHEEWLPPLQRAAEKIGDALQQGEAKNAA